MAYSFCVGHCCSCGKLIQFNPDYVPSLRVNGKKEPICKGCFLTWNKIHRTDHGLEPIALHPQAFEPENENI